MRLKLSPDGRFRLDGNYRKLGFHLQLALDLKECMADHDIIELVVSSLNEELLANDKPVLDATEIAFLVGHIGA